MQEKAVKKMGTSNKTEDQMTEALLRNYVKQQRQPDSLCPEFDPDTANAYLERVLTETENSRFEVHLSACSFCRKSIFTLAQLAEVEVSLAATSKAAAATAVPAASEQTKADPGEVSLPNRLKNWFGGFATPRFAFAAIAALVLAVTIPLVLLSNRQADKTTDVATAKSPAVDAPQAFGDSSSPNQLKANESVPTKPAEPAASSTNSQPAISPQETARQKTEPATGTASGQTAASGGNGASITQPLETKNEEAKPAAATPDNQPKLADAEKERSENRVVEKKQDETSGATVANNTPAPPAKKELAKLDPADTMRIQEADKDKSSAKTLKPGAPSEGKSRGDNKVAIKPEDATQPAPPPAPREAAPHQGVTKGTTPFRNSKEKLAERSNVIQTRRIKDKSFWLIDGVWTDRGYSKEKELPVVPLIKDSENYNEVLLKNSGLQKYFSAFGSNDRAIIVYKDTVYKLYPQGEK